jgi:hypothetical protein
VLALKSTRDPFRKREKELWALWGQQDAAIRDAETALSAAEEQASARFIRTTSLTTLGGLRSTAIGHYRSMADHQPARRQAGAPWIQLSVL